MSHVSQANSRMELISEEDDRAHKRRHSRSRSNHKCRRGVKHHAADCRKHSESPTTPNNNNNNNRNNNINNNINSKKKSDDRKFYVDHTEDSETGHRDDRRSRTASVQPTNETHEVHLVPQFRLQDRIQKFEERSRPKPEPKPAKSRKAPPPVKDHTGKRGPGRPTYVANARKVLMNSARGLLKLQGSLASVSSLYVNDMFEDGAPCGVTGCPLNPETRYINPKGDEPLFSRASSSSDESLEVRKRSSLSTRRWCLCISVAILFVGMMASAGIYFGYSYLKTHTPVTERVYRGRFRLAGESGWVPEPGSIFHTQKSEQFRSYIHQLFSSSALANQYKTTEVFLLESDPETRGVLVNFNIHFQSTSKHRLFAKEIATVLESQIKTSGLLPDIDLKTLVIQEREHTVKPPGVLRKPEEKPRLRVDLLGARQCVPLEAGYCSQLPYNVTTLPNILGHTHNHQVLHTISTIKTIVDSGCYPLSYELLCQFVQPICYKERIVPPCQAFCQEFLDSCGDKLPSNIGDHLDCNILPNEADGPGACISKPGCVDNLRNSGKAERVCDGVVDCPDFSDELYCPYCPEKHFHCGVGKDCIPKKKMCDGEQDCSNGADEKGCVSLSPRISAGNYIHHYHNAGYVLFQQKGEAGKICAESLNGTDPELAETTLRNIGDSVCQALEYSSLEGIAVGRDEEREDIQYIDIADLQRGEFITTECPTKTVVRLECQGLQCGRRALQYRNTSDPVMHGDWPWQVSLVREGVHVCDGTLVSDQWVMSTASCFQGQNKAKWLAALGSVRLSSRAPWEQARRIVGMVKSGVEGTDIVLLKLDSPIIFSDFARPICIPQTDDWVGELGTQCFSLGWDNKQDILRPINLAKVDLRNCEDKSEVSVNSLCTESTAECTADVVAGAGLVCQSGGEWHLVGVSSWRRGCGQLGGGRPRLYDKVSPAAEWATKVINKINVQPINPNVPRRRLGLGYQ